MTLSLPQPEQVGHVGLVLVAVAPQQVLAGRIAGDARDALTAAFGVDRDVPVREREFERGAEDAVPLQPQAGGVAVGFIAPHTLGVGVLPDLGGDAAEQDTALHDARGAQVLAGAKLRYAVERDRILERSTKKGLPAAAEGVVDLTGDDRVKGIVALRSLRHRADGRLPDVDEVVAGDGIALRST